MLRCSGLNNRMTNQSPFLSPDHNPLLRGSTGWLTTTIKHPALLYNASIAEVLHFSFAHAGTFQR
jgi:hypothetical protein